MIGDLDELVMLSDPQGVRAEEIRSLRTRLSAQHMSVGRRAVALCGPSEGVGCTFVAVNLAVAMSQMGASTLLIDANLRQPGVDHMLKPSHASAGLAGCLRSRENEFASSTDDDVQPNLSVIYAGGGAADAHDLLASERFNGLIDYCLRKYDFTIVDTPPANTSSDAVRVSSVVGYSLIVARSRVSFVDDVKTLATQLREDNAEIIGTVLNGA